MHFRCCLAEACINLSGKTQTFIGRIARRRLEHVSVHGRSFMKEKITYRASCHCGSVRFRFDSEEITKGCRCNCSICKRKGIVISAAYLPPEQIEQLEGMSFLTLYRFGDKDVNHYFCRTCGICPFITVASVPPTYVGSAKPGYYRVNLGCVESLDVYGLAIEVIDGRSL